MEYKPVESHIYLCIIPTNVQIMSLTLALGCGQDTVISASYEITSSYYKNLIYKSVIHVAQLGFKFIECLPGQLEQYSTEW